MKRRGWPGLYRFLKDSIRRLWLAAVLLILAASVLRPSLLPAQTVTGNLQGRMLEASGEPVPGMSVTVRSANLLGERGAITDKDGFFQVLALPPGAYTVRLERVGLRSVLVQEVQVALGRTTNLGELRTQIEPVEMEALVVIAGAPNIDPVHTSVGATLQVKDFAMLPAERDYKSVIAVLPHVTESYRGDVLNVGGATGPENMYFIDGMNATAPLYGGMEGTTLPYNFIRSIEVKVGGYEAQYGKALGAVVNAVTYSGTNQHEVSVFGFGTNSALAAESKAEPTLRTEDFRSWDVGARVSGPVLRDRLWYSAAYNPRIEEARKEIAGHGFFDDRRIAHLFAGKLTWQASSSVNLELAVVGDPTVHDRVSVPFGITLAPRDPDPFLVRKSTGGHTAALHVRATPASRLLLEGSVGRSSFLDSENPRTKSEAGEIFFADYVTSTMEGPYSFETFHHDMDRSTVSARATLLLDRHTILGGAEFEDVSVYQRAIHREVYRNALDSYVSISEGNDGTTTHRVPTVFLQDSWLVWDRFTLSAGVRWSSQSFIDEYGRTAQKLADEWQPRLGFVLQLGRPGTQRVFGSYGRFFQTEPGFHPAIFYKDFSGFYRFCTSDPREPGAVCTDIDGSSSASDFANAAGDLEVENLDEFTLGYEVSLSDFGTLLVRGIRRDLRSSFQWGLHPDTARGFGGLVFGTPGKGDFDFLPPPKREYTALELDFRGAWKRMDYRASYVLSRAWGNYTGYYVSDLGFAKPGGPPTFQEPHHAVNSTGLLPNDHTHVLKLTNVYQTGFGLTVGSFFTWQSGTPLNEFGAGPSGSLSPAFLVRRGSAGRTPSLWNVDLRLAYDAPCPRAGSCRLFLDALHLGNPQEVTWTDEFRYFGIDEAGNQTSENPDYLKPVAYQPPMMFRIGFEIGY
jgi:hypothetical protein